MKWTDPNYHRHDLLLCGLPDLAELVWRFRQTPPRLPGCRRFSRFLAGTLYPTSRGPISPQTGVCTRRSEAGMLRKQYRESPFLEYRPADPALAEHRGFEVCSRLRERPRNFRQRTQRSFQVQTALN